MLGMPVTHSLHTKNGSAPMLKIPRESDDPTEMCTTVGKPWSTSKSDVLGANLSVCLDTSKNTAIKPCLCSQARPYGTSDGLLEERTERTNERPLDSLLAITPGQSSRVNHKCVFRLDLMLFVSTLDSLKINLLFTPSCHSGVTHCSSICHTDEIWQSNMYHVSLYKILF